MNIKDKKEFEANARKFRPCFSCGENLYIEEVSVCPNCGVSLVKEWKWYCAKLKHDNGLINIHTFAYTEEGAIKMIMEAEGCPRNAIVSIAEVKDGREYAG